MGKQNGFIEENTYDALNRLSNTIISYKETASGDDETEDQTVIKFRSSTENQYNGEGWRTKKTVTKGEGKEKTVSENNCFYQDGVVSYTTYQDYNGLF